MRIVDLTLYSHNLEAQKRFYSELLGFEILDEGKLFFTIQVGWSRLRFLERAEKYHYHYCFLIPSNKLEDGMKWMSERVAIIEIEKGRSIQKFDNWNAESFYFYDASGNIAECIVRYDLKNEHEGRFDSSQFLCVNEIGMPTRDIEGVNQALSKSLGTEFWKGDLTRFGTHGDQEGLFLLPNPMEKEYWFPTQSKIAISPFEVEVSHDGKKRKLQYELENIGWLD